MQPRVVGERDVADLEERARTLPRRRLGAGYRREEVDAFIREAGHAMRDLVRVNEARRAGVSPDHLVPRAARPVTPFDVQDRRFRLARSGYRLGAVDELLDDVTDLLQALLQENEALRSTAGTDDERTDR